MKLFGRRKAPVVPTVDQGQPTAVRRGPAPRIAAPRPPRLRSIGNVPYQIPPSRAFAPASNPGGGGPGNAGAQPAQARLQRMESDVQPSWHYESQYEYFNHARPATTPHLAGIPANNFRNLGDVFGGRG